MNGEIEALMRQVKGALTNLKNIHPTYTDDLRVNSEAITNPGYLADFVASSALIDYKNKQVVLEAYPTKKRLEQLLVALNEESMLLECEHDIQMQVKEKIDRHQKDYFLREQIRVIQSELGEDEDDEIIEIPEDDVPRAEVPNTGDQILPFVGLAIASGVAAIFVGNIGKKKEEA